MQRIKSLADQPVSRQARQLAEDVYRLTFEPSLRDQTSMAERMRQLAVEIATDLGDAREHDRLRIKARCNSAQQSITALRRECLVNAMLGSETPLKSVVAQCDELDKSVDRLTTVLDSLPAPTAKMNSA